MSSAAVPAKKHDDLLFWWAVWSCLGMMVACALRGFGVYDAWTDGLRGILTGNPFYLSPSALADPTMSPGVSFSVALLAVFYTVVVMLREPSRLRRLFVWFGMLFVLVMSCMVGIQWDAWFNVMGSVVAVAVGGLGALFSPDIHALHAAKDSGEGGAGREES